VLPQRQTALVAKQAAEVDVLSGGRLRLGVGLGWNPGESEAMGQEWSTRARRMEEQVEVLRALWTQEVVNFEGRWHRITYAGINPLPVQRPIPIWIGAGSGSIPMPPDVALRRIGRIADGWILLFPPDERAREAIDRVNGYAREAGRDPSTITADAFTWVAAKGPGMGHLSATGPEEWAKAIESWRDLGIGYLTVATQGAGLSSPQEHIETIRRFKEVADG
jgi:probable F420-dependent oxidoreductase